MTVRRRNHGRGHSYWDGDRKLDAVTWALDNGIPKPGLIKWSADQTAGYAIDHWDELSSEPPSKRLKRMLGARYDDLDQAGRRGTEVHELAEPLTRGEQVDVPEPLAGHVESAVKFLDQWQPEPILTETTVVNYTWRYAGTTDGVFRLPDGRIALYDWKTSRSGIFGEVALQLAAYAHAEAYVGEDGTEHPIAELGVTDGLGIHIRADGYDVYRLDVSDRVFKAFLHVLTVARTMRDDVAGWKSDALDPPTIREAS